MLTVRDYVDAMDTLAPFSTAQEWDNVGLLIGSAVMPVRGVLLALDVTGAVIEEAVKLSANLIITHHPVIFHPLKRIGGDSLVYKLIQKGIAVISAHTNLDAAAGGVNDVLAGLLGLREVSLLPGSGTPEIARVGKLPEPQAPAALAAFVKKRLGLDGLKYSAGGEEVSTVALCGGSGGGFVRIACEAGAQALVTSEVKHNYLLEAHSLGMTVVDAGHFGTENPVMQPLVQRLAKLLPEAVLTVSAACTDSVNYI